jgi:cytochrome c oxidase subunit 2
MGRALSVAMLLVLASGVALALGHWFPEVASLHGIGVQRMLNFTLLTTGIFFVVGHLALAYLVGQRRDPAETDPPPASLWKEWRMALIPALVMAVVAEGGVFALGLPVWDEYYGPATREALNVEVVGRQFFWIIRYPGPDQQFGATASGLVTTENTLGLDKRDPAGQDDIVLLNELHLPANRPVRLQIRSLDVIHSFFLPEFRVKQDAMPGMRVSVWFVPTQAGDFEIACNQICGLGHYRMRGSLHVTRESDFEVWLEGQTPFANEI